MLVLAAPASSPSAPSAAEAGRSAPVKPSPMATDMREKAVVAGAVFCAASLTLSESFLRSGVTEPTAPRTLARPSSKSSVSALKRIVTSSAMYGFSLIDPRPNWRDFYVLCLYFCNHKVVLMG